MAIAATLAAGFRDSDMQLDKREKPNFREMELNATMQGRGVRGQRRRPRPGEVQRRPAGARGAGCPGAR
eukprot:7629185-Pyramimonas_sp.AAC.1